MINLDIVTMSDIRKVIMCDTLKLSARKIFIIEQALKKTITYNSELLELIAKEVDNTIYNRERRD